MEGFMEGFKGDELLRLYYKRNTEAITNKYNDEKEILEANSQLLIDVREIEEDFNKAYEDLRQRFIEEGKGSLISLYKIPSDFFSVDVNKLFKDEFKEIDNRMKDELDKLSYKCTTIKAHLYLSSTTQEAYTILRNFKVINKKDEIVIDDFSK